MFLNSKGIAHFHLRKRIYNNLEEYPNPDKLKRFIDNSIFFVSFIGPIMTIPQLYEIWIVRNASGVSTISWASYLFVNTFWLVYGILHKEKPIIMANALWLLIDILIVGGTIFF